MDWLLNESVQAAHEREQRVWLSIHGHWSPQPSGAAAAIPLMSRGVNDTIWFGFFEKLN